MNSDLPDLRGEFLDDFYSECDELLGHIRAQLTLLDAACRAERPDPVALEALFRHAHSLKGISAMVGLREAEQLAHAAEGLLRLLSRGETTLAPAQLDLLGSATHRLEQIVTAHRLGQPLPAAADLIKLLNRYDKAAHASAPVPAAVVRAASENKASSSKEDSGTPALPPEGAENPTPAGASWRASFAPSAELDKRGINVNAVRARLAGLGQIVAATPLIQSGGRMSFEFSLVLSTPPADVSAWEADGIFLRPVEAPEPAVPRTSGIAPETGSPAAPSSMFVAPSHIVRVDLSRLDELMRIVGEMVIHRSRLDERIARGGSERSELQEVNLAMGRSLREMREAITRVRLVSVAEIFDRLPFVVRDLARETEKKVRLVFEGQDTEIDKYVVERLKEPLLHLVRNAISHGVETPAERVRAGKAEEAILVLSAATSGQWAVIRVRDDGRGLDAKKISAQAEDLGIAMPETPTAAELLAIISRPGFSTRSRVDRASGRGIGMAVVHRTVRDLGGSVSMDSEPGKWTRFTLRMPLTLSIAETILVSAAGQICAVPQSYVEEILQFSVSAVRTIHDAEVISYRDGVLPLVRLRRMFDAAPSPAAELPVLVLGSERGLCGLVVDQVHGQREVVVRSMHDPLIQVPGVSGATELGDGRPVLILDPVSLSNGAVRPRTHIPDTSAPAAFGPAASAAG